MKPREDSIWIINLKYLNQYQLHVHLSYISAKHGKQEPWTFPKAKKLAEHIKMDQNLVKYSYL